MAAVQLRTILLILLTISLDLTFTLEQPTGSLLEFFPRFRWLLQQLVRIGGDAAVHPLFARTNHFLKMLRGSAAPLTCLGVQS